jgi:hypothetical protein
MPDPRPVKYTVDDLDLFALKIVIREGMRGIALNRGELIVAAKVMQQKGYDGPAIADILGISLDLVQKFWRLLPPVPLDEIPQWVKGGQAVPPPAFSKAMSRAVVG